MGGTIANYFPFRKRDVIRQHHRSTTRDITSRDIYSLRNGSTAATVTYYASYIRRKFMQVFEIFFMLVYCRIYFIYFILLYMRRRL